MSLKWKISAELIPAGGVKGGEAQLPLALQHGRTEGRTEGRLRRSPCLPRGQGWVWQRLRWEKGNRSPGERRGWDAAFEWRSRCYCSSPGNKPSQPSRCWGPPSRLVPALSPAAVTPLGAAHGGGQRQGGWGGANPRPVGVTGGMSALSASLEAVPGELAPARDRGVEPAGTSAWRSSTAGEGAVPPHPCPQDHAL